MLSVGLLKSRRKFRVDQHVNKQSISNELHGIVFYCIVLYSIVLYFIVVYCIVLYSTVLYCIVLH